MICQRCGMVAEQGNFYCTNCGSRLFSQMGLNWPTTNKKKSHIGRNIALAILAIFVALIAIGAASNALISTTTLTSVNGTVDTSHVQVASPPTSTTIDGLYIAIVGVSNYAFGAGGDYNITLYVGYSGSGSGNFADVFPAQIVTSTNQVIGIGFYLGGGELTDGEFTYVSIIKTIPSGETPVLLQLTADFGFTTVSLSIPSAPYSVQVR